jgi:hypothetical protein
MARWPLTGTGLRGQRAEFLVAIVKLVLNRTLVALID